MFKKLLIANRGEIACRIIKTAKKMGIATVAVYSTADTNAQHVKLADEAIYIGASPANQSYLQIDKIIAAAKATNSCAIHPGYGFLSENDQFAQACIDNGIVFVGPPVAAILAMGLKATSKALMEKAGVPLTPGYHGDNQDPNFLKSQADRIGYPVLIKASAGGGGKGMSLVECEADFLENLSSCKKEALSSFGNDDVLIERYVVNPRHVEVQIFGDKHGNYVHLFERDCSVQRRHQKVIEEAPAPNIDEQKLAIMRKAAIDAAKAVHYEGAGTVEFIVEQDGTAYFMEMNTRLQVEHPVTEMITGVDLVEWQLRVANGEALPKTQAQIECTGCAIEARIYAEIPEQGYLPATGKICHLKYPVASEYVRIDSGVVAGDEISTYYDPMIAKLIVWGKNRTEAIGQMRHALACTQVDGLGNNIAFLDRIMQCQSFVHANLDTHLIGREEKFLLTANTTLAPQHAIVAGLIKLLSDIQANGDSIWFYQPLWRINTPMTQTVRLNYLGEALTVFFTKTKAGYHATYQDQHANVIAELHHHTITVIQDNHRQTYAFSLNHNTLRLFVGATSYAFDYPSPSQAQTEDNADENSLKAPMPGIVTQVMVQAGDSVEKDAVLLTMEAMKIVYTIKAPHAGVIAKCYYNAGDQVKAGDELVQFVAQD